MIPLGVLASARAVAGGGWTPASLPGLWAWFDASDAGTITDTGGVVTQWVDKSGNSRHVTATTANGPSTGIDSLNGHNVLSMHVGGVGKRLINTTATMDQPLTTLGAFRVDAVGSGSILTLGAARFYTGRPNTATQWNAWLVSNSEVNLVDSGTGITGPHVSSFRTTGSVLTYRIDAGRKSGTDTTINGTLTTSGIGVGTNNLSAGVFNGVVGELLIYSAALSDTDLLDAETYLMTKWGIA